MLAAQPGWFRVGGDADPLGSSQVNADEPLGKLLPPGSVPKPFQKQQFWGCRGRTRRAERSSWALSAFILKIGEDPRC